MVLNSIYMKTIFISLLIVFFSFPEFNKSDIRLRIINKKLKDNEKITFQIKNNSSINYCFIIDTVFPIRSKDYYNYLKAFINPKLTIYDSQNKINSIWIKDIDISYNENSQKNTNSNKFGYDQKFLKENKLSLIFVKAKTTVNLNMPFNLLVRDSKESIVYYKINNNEKYKCEIEYSINKEFVNKKIPIRVTDSIKNKGYRFFIGSLKSNRVPLFLN